MNKTLSRLLTTVVAVVLSLVWGSSMASAQTISPTPPPDEGRTGVVTVTALANSATIPTPVVGASFELYPVLEVDVHDAEDWAKIKEWFADSEGVIDTLTLGDPVKVGPTGDKGRAESVEVPAGLYVLKHTSDDEVSFADALFTVPTLGFEDEWVYDLLVYPKVDCGCEEPEPTPTPEPTATPTPTTTPSDKPVPPKIQSGDGTDFDGTMQILAIVGGVLLLGGAAWLTMRRREGSHRA